MAVPKKITYTPLELGSVFQYTLDLYLKYFADILIYALLNIAFYMLLVLLWQQYPVHSLWFIKLVRVTFLKLVPFVSTAALLIYINEHEHRKNISLRTMVRRINAVLIPLIFTSMLVTIINLIGLATFIIPGIIFIVMFSQAYFFTLYKKKFNPFAALSASEQLTRHNRLRILWVFTIFSLCYLISSALLKAVLPQLLLPLMDTIISAFLFILNYSIWSHLRSNP